MYHEPENIPSTKAANTKKGEDDAGYLEELWISFGTLNNLFFWKVANHEKPFFLWAADSQRITSIGSLTKNEQTLVSG